MSNGFTLLLLLVCAIVAGTQATASTSFAILANAYINNANGTFVSGNIGYTTGPAVPAIQTYGTVHASDATYTAAGTDQGTILANLNAVACTFNFTSNTTVDLATDTTHGTAGSYAPGVYCAHVNMTIAGTGTIYLNGSGTYVFRTPGMLTTGAGSSVVLNGTSSCSVWWTPTGTATLGITSYFVGTVITDAGISAGEGAVWYGSALAFGGSVTTETNLLTLPLCAVPPADIPSVAPLTSPPVAAPDAVTGLGLALTIVFASLTGILLIALLYYACGRRGGRRSSHRRDALIADQEDDSF